MTSLLSNTADQDKVYAEEFYYLIVGHLLLYNNLHKTNPVASFNTHLLSQFLGVRDGGTA